MASLMLFLVIKSSNSSVPIIKVFGILILISLKCVSISIEFISEFKKASPRPFPPKDPSQSLIICPSGSMLSLSNSITFPLFFFNLISSKVIFK